MNQSISKFGQEVNVQCPVFFWSDNSVEATFGLKSGTDSRNMKNIVFGFKFRRKKIHDCIRFFLVGTNLGIESDSVLLALIN